MGFFQNINFSSANEDGETELAALAGAERIVCLTGSGTRPLDLLLSDAKEVVALDINPAQNALLVLKAAAMERLDHGEFLAFAGIAPSVSRNAVYELLRPRLTPPVRDYWDRNRRVVAAGVWHAGKWEKLLRWNARFLKLFRGPAIARLMSAPTVEAQAEVWIEKFNDRRLRAVIAMIGRDWIWRWVMREPAGEFLPGPRAVEERLAHDFQAASGSFLFRDSDFATLVFAGAHSADGALPVHLRPQHYAQVRENLPRLRIVQGGLADLATLGVGTADGFSLSDFGSYCGPQVYTACWRGVIETAAPGAKYCERIFMNEMEPPFEAIAVNRDLSARLTASDKAIVYRIRAGVIDATRR